MVFFIFAILAVLIVLGLTSLVGLIVGIVLAIRFKRPNWKTWQLALARFGIVIGCTLAGFGIGFAVLKIIESTQ